ncbi:MAG: class I SAM-dependent methyltransferase [Pyrinomonadaceae bacterium]
MSDSINRFTTRVENYAKYRPTYPLEVIDLLKTECGLSQESLIADVGSGTGILSELFLRNGNRVFCVEPNSPMRTSAEALLRQHQGFISVDATAESTSLNPNSVDIVTAAQAFHWFEPGKARTEFVRILKPKGWVVLLWNERRLDSTSFLRAYEELLLQFGTDYKQVRHENAQKEVSNFFAPQTFREKSFENVQCFDFESLRGRVLSASYTPEPGDPRFEPMLNTLSKIFDANKKNGNVTFEYDTKVYYGHLTA